MADKLLAARGAGQVGQKWPANFVKRTDSLRTCFNRAYDRQRALCENPALIRSWFELIEKTKAELGICDEDIYNFDEAGFIMGKITTQLVITGAERRGRPKTLQPGNREWVTLIAAISAAGWSVPPFLIFAGQYHLSAWYEEAEIPRDWAIAVSDNGWTNNELGVEWLKHFNAHTQARTIGARRLLIIDGHKSHQSLAFQELCKENNIYTLCMPPHSSHLLQPLNIGCFSPLKRAYSREVESLMRNHINHITKLEFLPAFKIAFDQAFTPANICSAFRGAGLVPLQPEAVLSKLDIQLRTPTPPAAALPEAPWVAQTPSNARELEAQSSLIRERVRQHKSSSPASIIEAINQLKKGAEPQRVGGALKGVYRSTEYL
ncbi:DDE superfamily endonuclease [Pyrenophora tritici-repentis]|uniref:DDE superfamily endonuclease n=1 Tax=Pyrenophora tritici-repentis TaxID=45151 RepID=A0A922SW12_9PLEO|nr:DDE superfamily endonuclease [Pyrenophora tritici-repentis]